MLPSPTFSSQPISQYPEYDALKGQSPDPIFKHLKLNVTSKVNPVSAGQYYDGLDGTIQTSGQFNQAFLYVNALVQYKKSFTPDDDFYFKLNEFNKMQVVGGHLSPRNSVPVPANTGITGTELLFDLTQTPYRENFTDSSDNVKTAYWLSLLNKDTKLTWQAFVSTLQPGGTIQEIIIYYKCVSITPDCSISLVK